MPFSVFTSSFSELLWTTMESILQTQIQTQKQSNKTSSKKRTVKKDKLYLEDYLGFRRSLQMVDLNIHLLNQIIYIHGFRKIYKQTKNVLVDAVSKLDLMDLPRSTLGQSVSAFATLALEDVIIDLNELGWQECCVTSVHTLSSCTEDSPPPGQNPQVTKHLQSSSRTKTSKKTLDAKKLSGVPPKATKNGQRATKVASKKRKWTNGSDAFDCDSTMDSVSLASN